MGCPGLLGHRVCLPPGCANSSQPWWQAGRCLRGRDWVERAGVGCRVEPGMGAVETGAATSLECLLGGMQWKRGAAAEQHK